MIYGHWSPPPAERAGGSLHAHGRQPGTHTQQNVAKATR